MHLPYATQVVDPLKQLFLQEELSDIPDICLNPNTDFSLITSNIVSEAIITPHPSSDQDVVSKSFDIVSEYMSDTDNIPRLQQIEYTAKAFATVLENSYTTINSVVAPIVDKLKSDITERYTELMTREKAESLLPSDSNAAPSESFYSFINWNNLTSPIRQNEIIENACLNANINIPSLSLTHLAYITKKMNFANQLSPIEIPSEVEATIINKLEQVSSNISLENIIRVWKCFSDVSAYNFLVNEATLKIADIKNTPSHVMWAIDTTNLFDSLKAQMLQVASEDLSVDTLQTLSSNIDVVSKTIYALQYWVLTIKELKYVNKLIITPTIINRQTYDTFLASGKQISDIHNYLKAFHYGTTIPMDGISLERVMEADPMGHLTKVNAKLKANETFIKSKCLFSAYEYVMRKYVIDQSTSATFEQVSHPGFSKRFISTAINQASHLAGDISNLDKVLYELFMTMFYKGTIVESMYRYLGKHFDMLAVSATEEITEDHILQSQCDAVVEFLTDYLFSTVVGDKKRINSALECIY